MKEKKKVSRRNFIKKSAGAAALISMPTIIPASVFGANDKVRVAVLGVNGRGTSHISGFMNLADAEVVCLCDPDLVVLAKRAQEFEKKYSRKVIQQQDLRKVFEDKSIDAVSVATPNHWHSLATIWACQAGKDVYVEKPGSHNIYEGRKMVEAAAKYDRIVQHGVQLRSSVAVQEAIKHLRDGLIGNVYMARGLVFRWRDDVGKKGIEPVPEGLNWDMWLGPAPKVPYNVSRHKSYNEWWAYSCGLNLADCSHMIDLVRMVMGDPDHPGSVFCAGGRVLYDDAREIPDTQTITDDFGEFPMTVEASIYGEYLQKASTKIRYTRELFPDWLFNGDRIEIYGTEGVMYLGRTGGGWQVFGTDSKIIAQGYGYQPDVEHQQDFIRCIRTRKTPNADIETCHKSATLVHLANLSYRVGKKQLFFDAATERVTNSEEANEISKGSYRQGFELPEIV